MHIRLPRCLLMLSALLLSLCGPACKTTIQDSADRLSDSGVADTVLDLTPVPDLQFDVQPLDQRLDLLPDHSLDSVDVAALDQQQVEMPVDQQFDAVPDQLDLQFPDSVDSSDGTTQLDVPSVDQQDVAVDLSGLQTISVKLNNANDAVTSYLLAGTSAWNYFYGDSVYLGRHFGTGAVSYHTALRFVGVAIPKGAQIIDVRLSFYPSNSVDRSNNLWINVYAEKSANSPVYDPTNYDSGRPDQRLKTSEKIDHWLVRCNDSCTDLSEYDCPQRKLDCWDRETLFELPKNLAALVQEVVDLDGWTSGSALSLFLINAATDQDGEKYKKSRAITGYDTLRGLQFSPTLTIQFIP